MYANSVQFLRLEIICMYACRQVHIEHTQWLWLFIVLYINFNDHLRTGMSKKKNIYIMYIFIHFNIYLETYLCITYAIVIVCAIYFIDFSKVKIL